MQTSYRGVNFQSSAPTLEVAENEMASRYRGESLNFSYVRHIPLPPAIPNPMNRLVTESSTTSPFATPGKREVIDEAYYAPQVSEKILHEVSAIHQENIRRNLERRLEVAKARGDQSLIRQLQVESQQLTSRL